MYPLLAILNPRNIPEVIHLIRKIRGYDKLWVKGMTQVDAYDVLRKWFIKHTEYTHLIILIDDVIITQNEFDILRADLEQIKNYPVLAGVGNVDYQQLDKYSPVMNTLPTMEASTYKWVTQTELDQFLQRGEYIREVKFEGFSLPWIRRDIVEQIEFRGPDSLDTHFAEDCAAKGIPIHVDFRAKMFHLKWRLGKGYYERMYNPEVEKPQIVLERQADQ